MAPSISTIFQLLPQTDCQECTQASCCSFASGLVAGRVSLSGCPELTTEARATIARIIKEHHNAAPSMSLTKEVEKKGFLTMGKDLALLPLRALWLLVFTLPISAPIWVFMAWLFLR
jgi:CO dehydrogenase/acetyl-CoA synthase gamma subunit (corrinoid Fe-S protein)